MGDQEILDTKRAMAMELFIDLDKNNDNFVDRKDLIKYYGALKRIEGASVEPQYKCTRGHTMVEATYNQDLKIMQRIILGFKPTNENKLANLTKYDKKVAEIAGPYKYGKISRCTNCNN